MSNPPLTLQMPSPPDPVPVVLDPATTALLIFDVIEHISARQPKIKAQMLPAIASLLAGTEGWPHHRVRDTGRKYVDVAAGGVSCVRRHQD